MLRLGEKRDQLSCDFAQGLTSWNSFHHFQRSFVNLDNVVLATQEFPIFEVGDGTIDSAQTLHVRKDLAAQQRLCPPLFQIACFRLGDANSFSSTGQQNEFEFSIRFDSCAAYTLFNLDEYIIQMKADAHKDRCNEQVALCHIPNR